MTHIYFHVNSPKAFVRLVCVFGEKPAGTQQTGVRVRRQDIPEITNTMEGGERGSWDYFLKMLVRTFNDDDDSLYLNLNVLPVTPKYV